MLDNTSGLQWIGCEGSTRWKSKSQPPNMLLNVSSILPNILACLCMYVEVEVNLRPTVSRPVCLCVRRPSETRDQLCFLLKISFRQLRVCYFVAPSLIRGWVCNLLYSSFWTLPEQSLLGRKSCKTHGHIFCLIWDSSNLEGQVPVFISATNRVAQLYPRVLGSLFVAFYDLQGCGEGILPSLHTGSVYVNTFWIGMLAV
jgi:hypothetical protein